MTSTTTTSSLALVPSLERAWQDVDSSFERFCLTAGIGAIEQMLCEDAQELAGKPHSRDGGRVGHRWGRTKGKIGFHGGNVAVHRPRVRGFEGHELPLPTWTAAQAEEANGGLAVQNRGRERVGRQGQSEIGLRIEAARKLTLRLTGICPVVISRARDTSAPADTLVW